MKILVKANKGGVGKSWITLQIAHKIALAGKMVVIITSDNQNNIPRFAGVKLSSAKGLEKWINNQHGELEKLRENLYYIPLSEVSIGKEQRTQFKMFIRRLETVFDYILIDATPVLELDDLFLEVADKIIIPTFLDGVTTESIIKMIKKSEISKIKAVVPNRATRCKLEKEYYKKLVETLGETSIVVTCPISQSAIISRLIEAGQTLYDKTKFNTAKFRASIDRVVEVIL